MGVTEAIEFIESSCHGETAKVLAGNFLLANDFGFGAAELFFGKPFFAKEFGFVQQFQFNQVGLLRHRAGVEGKITGCEANEVLRADVVGKTELFANAEEQTRAKIAAGFLEEFESIAIRIVHGRALITNEEDGLLFVASLGNALYTI